VTTIGIGMVFGAYALGMWGYCLVRGYNVTFPQLFGQTWPGQQVNSTAPADGHSLGVINNNTEITNPAILNQEQNG